ncbi:related to thiamine-phosphate diphosphorylase / hydroxyethylthiazole kinase [Melanopsichium pennsylvanicum]|uniref:Related to thiamine-phosphate diphosphorylase / hydroxyethylthiazole kinase n=2 Tax=Melanopsichium pennsylvanicum TaxID=63383 RepID=A0AAJ4XLE6_9BASI|nr:related to thiamine-phosphate diphosphorylase/hydroxyethylthiazole kinase [Melanopsichium pennsylvanicum 4]SNX84325.1 related to thiamine-phosphate diphosphorylase / hydroxyethylthiazole kinase [Melanopsichium pennsylvanicum]
MSSFDKSKVDYSVYLVTGRELLPFDIDYYTSLEKCLSNGDVTVVQIREKDTETNDFLSIAQKSLVICDKYNVPMLINDNISVCLSLPERVGLHIGQEDIPVSEARRILGDKRLLGISVKNVEQARVARDQGMADYAGVGPCYGTLSKAGITEDKVIGNSGAQKIVAELNKDDGKRRLPCVLIGGLNQKTAARTLFGATSETNAPDGIAVISAIVGRTDSDKAAKELAHIVKKFKMGLAASSASSLGVASSFALPNTQNKDVDYYTHAVAQLLTHHRKSTFGPPLIQTITSHVSSTMSANLALAFSSSPIMSHEAAEAADLSLVVGALVLNIGTISPASREGMYVAGTNANRNLKPVVLDPVGGGATQFRQDVVRSILNHTQVTLLKGNAAELASIAGKQDQVKSRGVDSGAGQLKDPVGLVKDLARKERCLVLLSGKKDYLTDGKTVITSDNGHPLMGAITGTGCALGVTVGAGLAAACNLAKAQGEQQVVSLGNTLVAHGKVDLLVGALTGLLAMTIASEKAALRDDVKGPGTFIPALQDELAAVSADDILKHAKLEIISS